MNMVADALSRCPDLQMNNVSVLDIAKELQQEIRNALKEDPECSKILTALQNPSNTHEVPDSYLKHFHLADGLLYFNQDHLCVLKGPLCIKALYESHDIENTGHQGIKHTY